MPFRVTARTLLHLGSELISSDGVAFYELIKNAFDAGSKRVRIDVISRLPYRLLKEWASRIEFVRQNIEAEEGYKALPENERTALVARTIQDLCAQITIDIDRSAPNTQIFLENIKKVKTWNEALAALKRANYIVIADTGTGMSLDDLSQVYLTIGTTSRRKERVKQQESSGHSARPILGEKGVGRLSVMRLGQHLRVKTSRVGETYWNTLNIDWSRFSHDSDTMIDDVDIRPERGELKDNQTTSGTTITIWDLQDEWSKEKLRELAQQELSRLSDPFSPQSRYPIIVRFNGDAILIPTLADSLFKAAHARVEANFDVENATIRLSGKIDYRLRGRETSFELNESELLSITQVPLATLLSLGPFNVHFYWYNRRILTAVDDIGERKQVLDLVNHWAGGLMVFRDGFRVYPYGSGEDDWLKLDKAAFSTGGYKVNKQQIIGKVDISSVQNPHLVDQTNREGLRDCDEKRAFVKILLHILISEFRTFLNSVDEELVAREPLDATSLEQRVQQQQESLKANLDRLIARFPIIKQESAILASIRQIAGELQLTMSQVKEMTISYETGRSQLVHLAGLGLMVEFLAHELSRTTSRALSTLSGLSHEHFSEQTRNSLHTLEEQVKTLQKRLRVLDPLDTRSRQIKERFDLVDWVRDILSAHADQFARHRIEYVLNVQPIGKQNTLYIHAVKGMFVQIVENLISNSVYWIKQQQKTSRLSKPKIEVTIDLSARELQFTDNGPGVDPSRIEQIFQPFVTAKPPGEGKGLGLFISREIATYNGCRLFLSDLPSVHNDRLNTFILALETTK